MATPTVDEILEKARRKPKTEGIDSIACVLDGEPIGKQVGRIQRSITNMALTWDKSKKDYEVLAREMFEDLFKRALSKMKFVPKSSLKSENGEDHGHG
jgi:hypothetical protein